MQSQQSVVVATQTKLSKIKEIKFSILGWTRTGGEVRGEMENYISYFSTKLREGLIYQKFQNGSYFKSGNPNPFYALFQPFSESNQMNPSLKNSSLCLNYICNLEHRCRGPSQAGRRSRHPGRSSWWRGWRTSRSRTRGREDRRRWHWNPP